MGEDIVGVEVVAPSIYNSNNRFREMTKKRDLTYASYNHQRVGVDGGGRGVSMNGNWNPKVWDWDPVNFAAKPLQESCRIHDQNDSSTKDEQNLRLNLGSCTDDPVPKSNKRVRSGSPGNNPYPMCQVDSCKEDLSNAKDYHRRHKVCEIHSKATKALVGKQMQRFCQQCSRFHPLSEFDEGKRSCRRRLAGHNRRRRKTQPEDVTSKLSVTGDQGNAANENMDIVNLLTVLARSQGSNEKSSNCPQVTDKEHLIQILNKINSLPLPEDLAAEASKESLRKVMPEQTSSEVQCGSTPSTMDLLAGLSSNSQPHAPGASLTQGSCHTSDSEKTKSGGLDQSSYFNTKKMDFPSAGLSSTTYQSPLDDSDGHFQDTQVNLPLQLFSSSPESVSPPKLTSASKYFSSDSSNPAEDMSPSSSPVVQKLFPVQASKDAPNSARNVAGVCSSVVAGRPRGSVTSFDLFNGSNKGTDVGSFQSSPYQAGYTCSSGSDHSPSSTSSDSQDRTGRIIFKLFDKDPSHFPRSFRAQIYSWLANSPSEMESYIRPGCVVLTIYIAMPLAAWEKLEENLLRHVHALVQDSVTDFWRSGRFLIRTDKQLASHKDGKLRLRKSWVSWAEPRLISVSPLAVVGGQETLLVLRGRNLNNPGTKIHCTYMGGYTSHNISASSSCENEMDVADFRVYFAPHSAPSRCFIEVENGFKGNSFPVIVADSSICLELRLLESEFEFDGKAIDVISEDRMHDISWSVSRGDVLHFLNELGWLFQRKKRFADYSLSRFKYLLIFSVERNFCAVVKSLLDLMVEGHKGKDGDGLSVDSLSMLSDSHLLSRAVKMNCKKMVDLLINYYIIGHVSSSRTYIFYPNLVGPGGLTPLHLAACTEGSNEMVDALTNDPLEIGLQCWSSLLDANMQSPCAYAAMRNNHSYNRLVAQKLADRKNGQVSVSIEMEQPLSLRDHGLGNQFNRGAGSCRKCAVAASMYQRRIPGASLLYRPYIHSMLAIAAVCVCVCLFLRGSPDTGLDSPFKWENLNYGTS